MKRIFFIFLLLLFAATLSAKPTHHPQQLRKSFKSLVDEAKVEPNDTFLISSLSLFATDMHKAHIPNCLSCSLYLLGTFKEDSLDRQLIASRYAIIISPDLPDGYFARFYNYILYSPLSFTKHLSNLQDAFRIFSRSPASLSVYEYFTRSMLHISLLLLSLFSMILLAKYRKQTFHTLQHITGFSLFYLAMITILFITVLYHIMQSNGVIFFILLPLIALEMIVVTKKELFILLVFSLSTTALFVSHSILKQYHSNSYNPAIAQSLINLYDPLFEEEANLSSDETYTLYLKGMHFFYKGSTSQSLYHLKRALKTVQHKTVSVSIHNAIGILEFQQQHIDKAIAAMREAWNTSHNTDIGMNLVRLLFEADQAQEAAHLEQQLNTTGTFLFPKIYLPASKQVLILLSNKIATPLFLYHETLMFIVSLLLIILVLFFLKRTFLTHITVVRCQECGALICSECSHGSRDLDVCAACQTIKQHRSLISVQDIKKHVRKQESFAKKRTVSELIAMLAIPGSGLILREHIIEGALYLTGVILFLSIGIDFDKTIMLFSSTFSDSASHIIFFGIAFALFLLSLIRTIRALME